MGDSSFTVKPMSSTSSLTSARRRVVVSGLGIVSALGIDEDTVWQNLVSGKTGIGMLRSLDTEKLKTHIGAEVPEGVLEAKLKSLGRRPLDRSVDMAIAATHDALIQSGYIKEGEELEEQDVPIILGSGTGTMQSHGVGYQTLHEKGIQAMRPTTVPKCMYNAISGAISMQFRLTGTNYIVVSACTSGTNAIGVAYRMIRDGYADRVVTGGADAFFYPFSYGAWNNIGALSRIEDPLKACRPFAADREGTALGEGAGTLILEARDVAKARGARIRGEILGYGESSDATHLTRPSADGQAKAMRAALAEAGLAPSDIALINAHGTGTPGNDSCESQSIRQVYGDAADDVPLVANKSYFGHTLGASGALECISSLLSMEKGIAPPNLNLENPDPECRVKLVGGEPMPIKRGPVMKNSFGFGGGNGVLILGPAD
jgi:3-oxoacyl-[acyl-carrier-protein] synthase II